MTSPDLAAANIDKIATMFPGVTTEAIDAEGNQARVVDFDLLRQELSGRVVEGPQERYQLDWPGKRVAAFSANAPIAKTLRPMREESVDFDSSKNLFIEGDNLDALKLLQESYLGKIRVIYIDPPYNTGSDRFVYPDSYATDTGTYLAQSGQVNDEGVRLKTSVESDGRYHSDWLSMMYPRLKLARNLLTDDGLLFVSIDSHEVHNLRKICDEIFGAGSHKNTIAVRRGIKNVQAQFEDLSALSQGHEYILLYARSSEVRLPKLSLVHEDRKPGKWDTYWRGTDRPTMRYELLGVTPESGQWRWERGRSLEAVANYERFLAQVEGGLSLDDYYLDHLTATNVKLNFVRRSDDGTVQYYVPPSEGKLLSDNWMDITLSGNETEEFDTEKSTALLQRIVRWACGPDEIVLDFFAGSATTGHAVMNVNAADGGSRRYVLVQLGEKPNEKSAAAKAGAGTIASVSRNRLRKAGSAIREGAGSGGDLCDVGFRALKVDTTNMTDVLRTPDETDQTSLSGLEDSVKPGRTGEDLLFQVLLDWGLDVGVSIAVEQVEGHEVFVVEDGALVACFESSVTTELVRILATREPLRAVFRDSGFASDDARINAQQIFKELSPSTDVKAI
ncbi:adenine-specific DNA-methyltransferase [Klenkia soli]|uniref:Adenine-specific DNA-methyltransferase n=2 Tax=Klenkia soli TaxID=1052260 RepID=A0A1H0Q0A4_9ACTN|nr:adenine-specific DNA-methyltransferase [Klenkia soli]